MHEVSVAGEIIRLVRKEMERRGWEHLDEIGVSVGVLSGVDPEALSFAFEAVTAETDLSECRLAIDVVALEARCEPCGRTFAVAEMEFRCPECGSVDIDVLRGQEMNITHLTGA
jgi:hydrogenase nickel incorporation protein HypA/HybF